MTLVNHLREIEGQNLFHAVAYGIHLAEGNLTKSLVTGSSPTHVITLQQMLGRGEWDRVEGLWWSGVEIKSDKYVFHPGSATAVPTLKTFTADNTTDVITSTAHGLLDGDEILMEPGDLPGNLAVDIVYFVRDKTANTFKVALTSGGTAIDLTSNGSGTLQFRVNDDPQAVDLVFSSDTPHSGIAWIRAQLAAGLGTFDTRATPPTGLKGIFRTTKVEDYDDTGTPDGVITYSANPARQVADLLIRLGGLPIARIDWVSWTAWRDFLATNISYDYTALTDFDGFGLTTKLYNGVAFDTLVSTRIDPVLEFVSSAGSPGVGVDVDNFSVKWEGYIKAKYTQTYTFYMTHTHGAKLYVNDLGTPIIDQWAATGEHSATFAMTAGTYYPIKVEWKHTTGNADFKLEWKSTSEPRNVITHRALYPATVSRPRYETHPFFAGPTRLDDAVRTILNLCNSTVQEVNGKLVFFCLEQLTVPSFSFTADNIVDGSVSLVPRDVRNLRNSWQAKFRDVDSQYLEAPIDPILVEREDLIATAGRKIDGEAIELYNCTVHQAYRTIHNMVKRNTDKKYDVAFTGTADTWPVLAGDRCEIDIEFLNWTAKEVLVLESNDQSSEESADERTFTVQEWTMD